MKTAQSAKKNNFWFLLWFPPVLFLLVIVLFSVYFGAQAQGNAGVIDPEQKLYICWYFLGAAWVVYLLTFVSGFAADIQTSSPEGAANAKGY